MKNTLLALLPLLAIVLSGPAQQLLQAKPQIERVLNPPLMGTFFLRQQKNGPPYPFDPFAGQLPVYEWKPGVFIVDDSHMDYPAMKSVTESGAGSAAAMSFPAPPPCESCPTNGSGGGLLNWGAATHSSNDLWLELANITNSHAFFTIHTPDTFGSYDLFTTTNLALTTNAGGLNRSNWLWLSRTAVSQTNLVLTNLWPGQGWFQLGTMLNSDSDGLPDAFEIHVSKTNPQQRDSNGNGTADADEVGCAVCHSVGLRAGPHSRTTPRTSWDNIDNGQNHLLRFLRGTNYPVRLMDNPYSKVQPSGQTNNTVHAYTAAYTAQFLNSTNAPYTLVTDTNQLFGTNRPMVLEALARTATVFVPDLIIAADADRNGVVNTSNRVDRTSSNAPMVFWINDDVDVGNDDTAGDEEPGISPTPINSATAAVDNFRDLEDFTRLHFRVEGLPGQLLTNVNLRTRIYLTNISGTPSLRLFRAAETNGGVAYLTNTTTGNAQISKSAVGVLSGGSFLDLAGTNWTVVTSNRFFLPFIFEGVSTGRCTIVFAIASNTGPDVAFSRPFNLELRSVNRMYEHWTVGDNINTPVEIMPSAATRVSDSAVFGSPQRNDELDYVLFVHGWRMRPWERRAFASTAYKRLWQLGYRGRFGLFSWPTDWAIIDPTNLEGLLTLLIERQNYDRSEERAWRAGDALERLMTQLNQQHPNRLRLLGHSMGNIVVSEALHLRGRSNNVPLIHGYIASQAASVAHAYDALAPEVVRPGWLPGMTTPEVYAEFPRTGNTTEPYFTRMNQAVSADPLTLSKRTFNFHNTVDFALDKAYSWPYNQISKPDTGYAFRLNRWLRTDGKNTRLNLPGDYREVYSWIAEARSKALGCAEDTTHAVRGEIGSAFDLRASFNYQAGGHEHSAQFNSINMNRRSYWWQVLSSFSLTNGLPTP